MGRIDSSAAELRSVASDAASHFGSMPAERLDRKPSENAWSAAQCFEHLIVTDRLYFPLLDRLASGEMKPSFFARYSPLSGFFGRFLVNAVDPGTVKRSKTLKRAKPSQSSLGRTIIERYAAHNAELAAKIERISRDVDLKMIVTSPLAGFVTYSLEDCLTILPFHARRHFDQAVRTDEGLDTNYHQ